MSNQKDYTYIATKAPSDLHVALADFVEKQSGVEVSAKQAQAVWLLCREFQKSEANKSREAYRPLDETIVQKRSEHMTIAHTEARELQAKAKKAEEESAARKAKPATRKPATRKSTRKPATTK